MSAPTLLVGLGGTGSKIVARVSRMIEEDEKDSIAFVVFDTDANDLMKLHETDPMIKTVQTSSKQTVGQYLSLDSHAREDWFPVNPILNSKVISEGAGQVRSISRLAVDTSLRKGDIEQLHEAIKELYKVDQKSVDQALRIVIVSSLAGGTGSGLILPVALYLRHYLVSHFHQNSNITRGFFILPEVFDEVIKGHNERNTLKANAYATLRELDAFLMKADGMLDFKYDDSIRIEFPRISAIEQGYDEFNVRPYDFCFLFDAQNAKGDKLESFDKYLEHAANCIYSQSIGPMNRRSNSSEDNVIRRLVREKGRNRYAGAGASMLVYPYKDIKRFIALQWTKRCLTDQWLEFDRKYKEQIKENDELRMEGLSVTDPSRESFYVNRIDSQRRVDDPFAKMIYNQSGLFKDTRRIDDKWTVYVQEVLRKTRDDLIEKPISISDKAQSANTILEGLNKKWEDYETAFRELEDYRQMIAKYVNEIAPTIAYSMFRGALREDGQDRPYQLKTYLKEKKEYIHPNSVRYLLIKIEEELIRNEQILTTQLGVLKNFFDTFEEKTFDDPKTEDVVETAADIADRKVSPVDKVRKGPNADQQEMKEKLRRYMQQVGIYEVLFTQQRVLSEGIRFIRNLIKAYETMYVTFETKIDNIDEEINKIYRKYENPKGSTLQFVLADRASLDAIFENKPSMEGATKIGSDLAQMIFEKALKYSLQKNKEDLNHFFADVFDDGVIRYYESIVARDYGVELDLDIISAIIKEGRFKDPEIKSNPSGRKSDIYLKRRINDIRKLSIPFIEQPMGELHDPIYACAFNTSLVPDKEDNSMKAQIVRSELMNYGGEADDDIDKNQIIFYQSFYGLRANDLSKFAPPQEGVTYSRGGGEYFKAYYDLVDNIHPDSKISKEINPHINKWWHIVTKMPDLDEENQKRQEEKIYAAFFWALLNGYVHLTEESAGKKIYKLRNIILNLDSDELFVSNGTECNLLYEVLDAIAIYPKLTNQILNANEKAIQFDINANKAFKDSALVKSLNRFTLEEPGIGIINEEVPAHSIFDIPMLIKKSLLPDSASAKEDTLATDILKVELKELYNTVSRFVPKKDLPEVFSQIILSEFKKHLDSIQIEAAQRPKILKESLFDKTQEILQKALFDLEMGSKAQDLEQMTNDLEKQLAQ